MSYAMIRELVNLTFGEIMNGTPLIFNGLGQSISPPVTSTRGRKPGRKRRQEQAAHVSPNLNILLKKVGSFILFSGLDFSQLAVLNGINRNFRQAVGQHLIYQITLTDSGLSQWNPKMLCAQRVDLAIRDNHCFCMVTLARVLCSQPLHRASRAYVTSLLRRAVPKIGGPTYHEIEDQKIFLLRKIFFSGQLSMVNDLDLWHDLMKAMTYGFCTPPERQECLRYLKSELQNQHLSPESLRSCKLSHDLLSYCVATDPDVRKATWSHFQEGLKEETVQQEIERQGLTPFVELLTRQWELEQPSIYSESFNANMLSLVKLSENSGYPLHVRHLAMLTVAYQQLKASTPVITDEMVCGSLLALSTQNGARANMRQTAAFLLASFQIAQRLGPIHTSDVDIQLFAYSNLELQSIVKEYAEIGRNSCEHGLRFYESLRLSLLVRMQLKRRACGYPMVECYEMASSLTKSSFLYSAAEARLHCYAKAVFSYAMGPDPAALRDGVEIQSLIQLLKLESNPKTRSKIQILIAKMHLDERSTPPITTDQMALEYAQEVQMSSTPGSRRQAEAGLLLGRGYLKLLINDFEYEGSEEFVHTVIQSLAEIGTTSSKPPVQQKLQAKLLLAEIYATMNDTKWISGSQAQGLCQEVFENSQAEAEMKVKAAKLLSWVRGKPFGQIK